MPESTDPTPDQTSEPPLDDPSTTESTETTESSTDPSHHRPPRTTATPTTTKTTPTTSKQVSLPTKLHCKSGALTSAGGVFCYEIPDGFSDTSSTATYPGTDKVKTAIQPSDSSGSARDLIFVTSTTLKVNSDELSDALIKTSLKQALKIGSTSSSTFSTLIQTKVAGDRAFETTIKFTDGVMQRYLLVFSGKTRVSVSCQWQDAKAAITAACKTVLSTMQIKNPLTGTALSDCRQPPIGVGFTGSGGTGRDPRIRFWAWQLLVQLVAPWDSSMASSPSTPPIRPPEATDHFVTLPSWNVLVATCGLSLPSSIWW